MILIDRAKASQEVILTLTELTTIVNPMYVMVIQSDALRDTYSIVLPANQSTSTSRFDLFNLETTSFDGLAGGYYIYEIYQQNQDGSNLALIEYGKLLIKDDEVVIEVITPIRDENYLVY